MESEGKAAGSRAVQQRLILWLSVLWDSGIFMHNIVGFFTHLPHMAPTTNTKISSLKEGI